MSFNHRRYYKVQRLVRTLKKCVAFLISHVGLCFLVIAYAMLGAVMFRAIESQQELETAGMIGEKRRRAVDEMWAAVFPLSSFKAELWHNKAGGAVRDYRQILLKTISKGYDAKHSLDNSQWSFSAAFLYSLAVSTTIGYGNIACRTYVGKGLTIFYAIIGIPIMLLFLTNIGDVLAELFTSLYKKVYALKLGVDFWVKKRQLAQRRKRALRRFVPAGRNPQNHAPFAAFMVEQQYGSTGATKTLAARQVLIGYRRRPIKNGQLFRRIGSVVTPQSQSSSICTAQADNLNGQKNKLKNDKNNNNKESSVVDYEDLCSHYPEEPPPESPILERPTDRTVLNSENKSRPLSPSIVDHEENIANHRIHAKHVKSVASTRPSISFRGLTSTVAPCDMAGRWYKRQSTPTTTHPPSTFEEPPVVLGTRRKGRRKRGRVELFSLTHNKTSPIVDSASFVSSDAIEADLLPVANQISSSDDSAHNQSKIIRCKSTLNTPLQKIIKRGTSKSIDGSTSESKKKFNGKNGVKKRGSVSPRHDKAEPLSCRRRHSRVRPISGVNSVPSSAQVDRRSSGRSQPKINDLNRHSCSINVHNGSENGGTTNLPKIDYEGMDARSKRNMRTCRRLGLLFDEELSAFRQRIEDKLERVDVPLTVVFLVMVVYLCLGALIFTVWEAWDFLDAFYFCFCSLATIGFGDMFPGNSLVNDQHAQHKLVIVSFYLLFGMALIAMSFNLAQEQVVTEMTKLGVRMGLVKLKFYKRRQLSTVRQGIVERRT